MMIKSLKQTNRCIYFLKVEYLQNFFMVLDLALKVEILGEFLKEKHTHHLTKNWLEHP